MKLTEDQKAQILKNMEGFGGPDCGGETSLEHVIKLMDALEIPDNVVVRVMTKPIEKWTFDGVEYEVMAQCRKLRADVLSDVPWLKDFEAEIRIGVERAKEEGKRLLWSPYWFPYRSKSLFDPKEYHIDGIGWKYRYGIKYLDKTE